MIISGFKKESLIDYPGKMFSIVFTGRCNYHCPSCHAKQILQTKYLIDENTIFRYLDSKKGKGWIDGVVICGGEPTSEASLKYFIKKIKEKGLAVKLDTNGNNLGALENLRKEKLVDYVAMDVKGPMSLYAKLVGKDFIDERDDVGKSIAVVWGFPDYEFRTTIVPVCEDNKLRWMTPEEIGKTAKLIYDWTEEENGHKYFLQRFVARSKDEMLDEKFARENLPEEMHETPDNLLEKCLIEARKYLPNTIIRG